MTAPWHTPAPDQAHDTPEFRRYRRALALTQFQRELDVWQRGGQIDHPRYAEKVAYRRMCIENWQSYLNGDITPHTGRKPR